MQQRDHIKGITKVKDTWQARIGVNGKRIYLGIFSSEENAAKAYNNAASESLMAKLPDLDPKFIRYEDRVETWDEIDGDADTRRERGCPTHSVTGTKEYQVPVESLSNAQGILFQCPKCHSIDGHYCSVTFSDKGVADHQGTHNSKGKPTRWMVSGNGFHDLTIMPSIQLEGGCNWHGYISNGEVK